MSRSRWILSVLLVGCSGASSASPSTPPAAASPQRAPVAVDTTWPEAVYRQLRPDAYEPLVGALINAPSAESYAQASLAYAQSDVASMSLIWGLTAYGAGGEAPALQESMRSVLERRITPREGGISVRLAPGSTPVLGGMQTSTAHALETHALHAVVGSGFGLQVQEWTPEAIQGFWEAYVVLLVRRQTLASVPVHIWLVRAAQAGLLRGVISCAFGLDDCAQHRAQVDAWRRQNPVPLSPAPLSTDRVPLPQPL